MEKLQMNLKIVIKKSKEHIDKDIYNAAKYNDKNDFDYKESTF